MDSEVVMTLKNLIAWEMYGMTLALVGVTQVHIIQVSRVSEVLITGSL